MRQHKENKPNKGFKKAFRAGIILVLVLSLLISWISVSIINSMNNKIGHKDTAKVESQVEELHQDTVVLEKIKEVKVVDTVYKYIQPIPPKPKKEESVAPKRDTLPK